MSNNTFDNANEMNIINGLNTRNPYTQRYYGTNQVVWKEGRKVYKVVTSKELADIIKIVNDVDISPTDFTEIDAFAKSCKGITREIETVDPSAIEELIMHGMYQTAVFLYMRHNACDRRTAEDIIERMKSTVVIEGDVKYERRNEF